MLLRPMYRPRCNELEKQCVRPFKLSGGVESGLQALGKALPRIARGITEWWEPGIPQGIELKSRACCDRRWLDVGDGCVGGFLEHHRLPGGRLGDQFAQQLIVQLVAGLVAAEFADEAVAE